MEKCMELKLCCQRCGGYEFELKELPLIDFDNMTYYTDDGKEQVICKRCGLEDYIFNLAIGVTQRDYTKFTLKEPNKV